MLSQMSVFPFLWLCSSLYLCIFIRLLTCFFHTMAIVSNAAMDIGVHIAFQISVLDFFR